MDNHKEVHRIIGKYFKSLNPEDGLPYGSGVRHKRDLFAPMFCALGYKTGAEIGVRKGKFSEKLLKANPGLKLYCIDPWAPYSEGKKDAQRYTAEVQELIYQEAVKRLSPYGVTFIRNSSLDALGDIPDGALDLVCIDGNHTFDFVCLDIIHWMHKLRSGGIMVCHDYHRVGVGEAVRAYTHAHHIDPWYVTKESQPTAYWVKP